MAEPSNVDPAVARWRPLEGLYQGSCETPSDTNEHLPLLRRLAERCREHGAWALRANPQGILLADRGRAAPAGGHVTELGMRWATGSTLAFLAASPAQLVSWELEPLHVVSQNVLDVVRAVAFEPRDGKLVPVQGATRWQPRVGNTLEVEVEETDMIFFDTYHTAKHLLAELMRHGMKARKFLAFHDTHTFGWQGEDGSTPGLRSAVWRFMKEYFPLWRVLEDRANCNGLVVLQREADFERDQAAGREWKSLATVGPHPGAEWAKSPLEGV